MLGDMDRKRFEEKVMSNRDQRSAESRALAEGGARGKIEAQSIYVCRNVPARRHINETVNTRQLTRRCGSGSDRGLGKII